MNQNGSTPACQECQYASFSQGKSDVIDAIALLASFLVLWVKPEITMFPAGLALYMIPCVVDAAKSWQRSNTSSFTNWLHGISLVVLGILAFFGVMGEISCVIDNDISVIVFSNSFNAIVPIPQIKTFWMLVASGIPLVFAGRKHILPKTFHIKRSSMTQQA